MDLSKIKQYYNGLFERSALEKIMAVNSDLIIRTACLLIMTNLFVAKGSQFGKNILAANTVLFQIQYIIAYLYDGLQCFQCVCRQSSRRK